MSRQPLDFGGIKQHTAADADRFQLFGALQPEKRRLADLQNRQSLGPCKQTRGGGLIAVSLVIKCLSPALKSPSVGAAGRG